MSEGELDMSSYDCLDEELEKRRLKTKKKVKIPMKRAFASFGKAELLRNVLFIVLGALLGSYAIADFKASMQKPKTAEIIEIKEMKEVTEEPSMDTWIKRLKEASLPVNEHTIRTLMETEHSDVFEKMRQERLAKLKARMSGRWEFLHSHKVHLDSPEYSNNGLLRSLSGQQKIEFNGNNFTDTYFYYWHLASHSVPTMEIGSTFCKDGWSKTIEIDAELEVITKFSKGDLIVETHKRSVNNEGQLVMVVEHLSGAAMEFTYRKVEESMIVRFIDYLRRVLIYLFKRSG
ncbi:unnamed protein product [Caenorhabditis sp. 36 PRJEB53466]|nr:unnamed protein product [Caenorhabditis sp. 36 PRJEB53466]